MTRRIARFLSALGVVTVLVSGACGDSTGVTGDPLTQSEAFFIFAELQQALADALVSVGTAPPATTSPALQTPVPSVTGDCSGGGTVSIEGEYEEDIDPVSNSGTVAFTFVESIHNCVVTTGGTTFTVNGAPNLLVSGGLTVDGDGFSVTGNYGMTGGFRYTASDDRSGTCDVDVQIDFGRQTTSGSVCGEDIST